MIAFVLEQFSPFIWVAVPASISVYAYLFLSKPVIRDGAVLNTELYAAMFAAPLLALVASRLLGPAEQPHLMFMLSYVLTALITLIFFLVAVVRQRHALKFYESPDFIVISLIIGFFCFTDYWFSYSGSFSCRGRCEFLAPLFGFPEQINFVSFGASLMFSSTLTAILVKIVGAFSKER
ncbi:MAG: hypothetical protein ACT6RF_03615 [Allorhizobium sp.]|uniref:hypothetical protein n=1 Tax=Allorhizobium sp. TaxID=633478 RepID=UPI0040336884